MPSAGAGCRGQLLAAESPLDDVDVIDGHDPAGASHRLLRERTNGFN
jgi:hypothetical protein